MSKKYSIDGQLYRMIEKTTLENDFYVMKQLRKAGLANCTPDKEEAATDYAVRLLYGIIEGGVPFELLGALLIPEGLSDEKWSIDQAETTAAALRTVTAPADKEQIQAILISLLSSFFAAGLPYLKPSKNVSKAENPQQPNELQTTEEKNNRRSSKTSANGAM